MLSVLLRTGSSGGDEVLYLPVDTERVPYTFFTQIGDKFLRFQFRYNSEGQCYTVSVSKFDGTPIVTARKIVYGHDLFVSVADPYVDGLVIIPYDLSQVESSITPETLGRAVKLWVIRWEEE